MHRSWVSSLALEQSGDPHRPLAFGAACHAEVPQALPGFLQQPWLLASAGARGSLRSRSWVSQVLLPGKHCTQVKRSAEGQSKEQECRGTHEAALRSAAQMPALSSKALEEQQARGWQNLGYRAVPLSSQAKYYHPYSTDGLHFLSRNLERMKIPGALGLLFYPQNQTWRHTKGLKFT